MSQYTSLATHIQETFGMRDTMETYHQARLIMTILEVPDREDQWRDEDLRVQALHDTGD